MNTTASWMAKSLAISLGIALLTCVGFYLFFHIHQELGIHPAYAFRLATITFILSTIIAMIYLRIRNGG